MSSAHCPCEGGTGLRPFQSPPRLPRGVSPTGMEGRGSSGSPVHLFPHFNTQVLVFRLSGHSLSKHLQAHGLCLGAGRAPARAVPAPSAKVKDPGEGLCSAAERGVPRAGTTQGLVSGATRLSRGVTGQLEERVEACPEGLRQAWKGAPGSTGLLAPRCHLRAHTPDAGRRASA